MRIVLRECANPLCRRLHQAGAECCSIECARALARLRASPSNMERALAHAQALDRADVYDVARTRALLLGDL